ncbi:hypothetical protein DFH28DRAFT_1085745 [Melampsora americana]|nr:hypothetical protein DFH28DRAFT_1085745 [Melampsora americana]
MSLSQLIEGETKNRKLDGLPSFSFNRGKNFSDGARRIPFSPTQLLKPADLKPINMVHPLDREDRKPRPVIRRPPTKKEVKYTDPFKFYNIKILKEPYNPELFSSFLTPIGRIKNRTQTGLSKSSQKKLAKSIRRARSMGFLPYFGKPLDRFSDEFQQRRDGKGVDLPSFAR